MRRHPNVGSNTVSVVDTTSNTVVAAVPVGSGPVAVGIGPPGIPFLAFGANLVIAFGGAPNQDSFALQTSFILSSTAPVINPFTEAVTLQAGTLPVTIPPGSFVETKQGFFVFAGVINGVALEAAIEHTGTLRYAFQAKAVHAKSHRDCEPGAGDLDHRQRHGHYLGQGPHFPLKPRACRRDPVHLIGSRANARRPSCMGAEGIAADTS